jgi:hypothetical protein
MSSGSSVSIPTRASFSSPCSPTSNPGALIVTSNFEFADWTSVFAGDERLTAALLDRLTHRCHLLEFRGSSYRFRQSLAAREGRLDGAFATPSPD